MIVIPEIDAVTLALTWNTRLAPPPLTVTPAAGPVIVCVPLVSLSMSWVPVRVIVWGVFQIVPEKVIVFAWPLLFAVAIAAASEPVRDALVLVTVNVASSLRSSSASSVGRSRRRRSRSSPSRARVFADFSPSCVHGMVLSLPGDEQL